MQPKNVFLALLIVCSFAVLFSVPAQAQVSAPFRVYLTFEDGPTDAYTPQILDLLAQYGAKATFFPNGYQIAGREAIIQRIVREGHALGNHLWIEPPVYSGAPDERVIESYWQTEDAVRAALAATPDLLAIYDAQLRIFRQPGGGANPFPASTGIHVITYNWNVDSDDCGWFIQDDGDSFYDDQVIDNVLNEPRSGGGLRWNVYEHGDGAIIAFHDINRVTGRVLPVILSELQAAGATFEALPRPWDSVGTMPVELGAPPVLHGDGVPGFTLTGTVIDVARVRALPDGNAEILYGSVQSGTQITLTGRSNGWYQVSYGGQVGWMFGELLDVRGVISGLPRR
ncbi:MAG: polysaccharide deacetylase family protein [Anaerolinea sp.]|nr:polysaccharide deacetylase family protein [Anaerolinea sp.]